MIVEYIIDQIQKKKESKALLVAFDGVDTSGKTTLADKVYSSKIVYLAEVKILYLFVLCFFDVT